VVLEPGTNSLLSVAERREKNFQPCHREEEIGQCLIQQWKEKCMNYVPGLMLWRQHRGAQLMLGISVKIKVKMKLEMKEKKLKSKMLQKNTYSRLLQG
jgi:hypothetical protein